MELWIRSQDKYTLMKIEEIQICENPNGTWFMNAGIVLGRYKSKERALEVLDEIEAILLYKKLERITGDAIIQVDNNVAIYEMPKE